MPTTHQLPALADDQQSLELRSTEGCLCHYREAGCSAGRAERKHAADDYQHTSNALISLLEEIHYTSPRALHKTKARSM